MNSVLIQVCVHQRILYLRTWYSASLQHGLQEEVHGGCHRSHYILDTWFSVLGQSVCPSIADALPCYSVLYLAHTTIDYALSGYSVLYQNNTSTDDTLSGYSVLYLSHSNLSDFLSGYSVLYLNHSITADAPSSFRYFTFITQPSMIQFHGIQYSRGLPYNPNLSTKLLPPIFVLVSSCWFQNSFSF